MPANAKKTTKDLSYVHEFPATRGIQAGVSYYSCSVPIRVLAKLFLFDEEEVPVELRTQRTLDEKRVVGLRDYVIDNPKTYVIPSLTVSIDGDLEFIPASEEGILRQVGVLRVAIAAKFVINDGQHRKAGLAKALQENPALGSESVSVLFYLDVGLKRCQQIFADINRNMKVPDASIGIAFDHRDHVAIWTREVIKAIPFLRQHVQHEGTSIKAKSNKLLVLTWLYKANQRISEPLPANQQAFLLGFWEAVTANMVEWRQVVDKEISPAELRRNYICCTAVVIEAIAKVGSTLAQIPIYAEHPEKLKDRLKPLSGINWAKTNPEWLDLILDEQGRILLASANKQQLQDYLESKIGVLQHV